MIEMEDDKMDNLLDNYIEVRECDYKGEHYSVRDNGAILRHSRVGKRVRPMDNVWTFGNACEKTGYMLFASERVHRIVAYAFLGAAPTPEHVVDHIDTNRRNNRPENLRWLTKLENVLNNPITRKRIELLCGSIEAFIEDPSIISEFANDYPNFQWMRTVTPEEAKISYEKLKAWADVGGERKRVGVNRLDQSIFEYSHPVAFKSFQPMYENVYGEAWAKKETKGLNVEDYHVEINTQDNITQSLSPNAVQKNWRIPTEFPLCPLEISDRPLDDYYLNLTKGAIFSQNKLSKHFIDDFVLCNSNKLYIRTHSNDGIKRYALSLVIFENGEFVHSGVTFFQELGAIKQFTLAQGLEWNGEDSIDDYCM